MIKHILTTKCNRKCKYCITKNIKTKQIVDETSLWILYNNLIKMSKENSSIMITGGEPTMAKKFWTIVKVTKQLFNEVYITTQNYRVLSDREFNIFNAINLSLHDINIVFPVFVKTPVYACIMADTYFRGLVNKLKKLGYSGLTINEDQRSGEEFNIKLPKSTKKFSIRVNRKGKCLDEIIILPDLSVINNFAPYL